jgi:hypothetical protein
MPTIDAPFYQALESCLEDDEPIARLAWDNEKVIVAQKGYPEGIAINGNTAHATGRPEGTVMRFLPYLMEHDITTDTCVPWAPTQEDIFATDWFVAQR